jgi:hypothetical protein
MASIAGITCTFIRGTPPEPTQRVETFQSPGVDGYGAQLLGLGDSEFEVTAVLFGTLAACLTWAAQVRALKGAVVSITTDLGATYDNRLIVEAQPAQITPAIQPGTTNTHRAEVALRGVRA